MTVDARDAVTFGGLGLMTLAAWHLVSPFASMFLVGLVLVFAGVFGRWKKRGDR